MKYVSSLKKTFRNLNYDNRDIFVIYEIYLQQFIGIQQRHNLCVFLRSVGKTTASGRTRCYKNQSIHYQFCD